MVSAPSLLRSPRTCRIALCVAWTVIFLILMQLFMEKSTISKLQSLDLTRLTSAKKQLNEILVPFTNPLDEQARVGKVTMMYGSKRPIYERALQTHKDHNRLHGYPMFVQRTPILDGLWSKQAAIQHIVLRELAKPESQRLQWLFWFDADTVLVNHKFPLEAFLPPKDDIFEHVHFIGSGDDNGLNDGAFAIRVSPVVVEILACVMAFRHFRPDTNLPFSEQSAFELVLKERPYSALKVDVPQQWFNAYRLDPFIGKESQVRPGDLIVHFAGVQNRDEEMEKWCKIAESHDARYSVPPMQTTAWPEIQKYWESVKSKRLQLKESWGKGKAELEAKLRESTTELGKTTFRANKESTERLKKATAAGDDLFKKIKDREFSSLGEEDIQDLQGAVKSLSEAMNKIHVPSSPGSGAQKAKQNNEKPQ